MLIKMEHPQRDELTIVGSPIKMSRTPVEYKLAPPTLGQHTKTVLGRFLSSDELQKLSQQGVIE